MKETAEVKKYSSYGTEQSTADVKLAVSIGWQNGGGKSNITEKFVEFGSMRDVRDTSTLSSLGVPACSRDNQGSPDSVLSMHSIANSSILHPAPYGNTTSSSNGILCRGLNHINDDLQLNDGKKNTTSSFHQRGKLDLNKYPCDESCSGCIDSAMTDSSRLHLASPSHRLVGEFQFGLSPCSTNGREQGAKISQRSSWAEQDADPTYTESKGKSNGQSDRGVHCNADIEYIFGMSPGLHRNVDSHHWNHNFMDTPTPSNETCREVAIEDSSSLKVKGDVKISSVSCHGNTNEDIRSKSRLFTKNYSVEKFSGTNIVQVGNDLDFPKVYSQGMVHEDESSTCPIFSLEHDSEPSSVNYEKPQGCHHMDEEPPQDGRSLQIGDVSLSNLVLSGSSKDQNAVEETNRTENVKKKHSQYSVDSFESIVLKLPERNVDDYCVTSKKHEVDDICTRECGIKLRRGARRLKDFRRDVLPHLPSLSSKEIWEDLKIMQDALRSREFKRLRSKVHNEESGSSPLKNRRTRSNRVAQRHKT